MIMIMNWLLLDSWSPYIVGIGIGTLVWLSFLLSDKSIGCSTAYARSAGMLEGLFRGEEIKNREYFQEFVPRVDWEWMLVLGIVFGSFLSTVLSGQFDIEVVPAIWSDAFGESVILRLVIAVIGGILIGFGARLAGGCTSGHGISGASQLAVSSWLAFVLFFVGGILTAMFMFIFLGGV